MTSLSVLSWFGGVRRPPPQQPILPIEEVRANLHQLCVPPNPGASAGGQRISEKAVRQIQIYLEVLDNRASRFDDERWKLRPRLYAILHTIGATELMDDFYRNNITDFHLPFNEQTLPRFVGEKGTQALRQAFFRVQGYYLTDVKAIESKKSVHMFLESSGDIYFVPVQPLGHGSFG